MKKSFSLIELIFTIVIIAFVFTVIPKVIYSTNQTFKFALKEDGIFNMMAKIMDISLLDWDENNTQYYDILLTHNRNDVLECGKNTEPKKMRIGGFYSGELYSRICPNDQNISHIGTDDNEDDESDFDDVDDYDNNKTNATKKSGRKKERYTIYITVGYSDEWNKSKYDYTKQTLKWEFNHSTNKSASNIKFIKVTLQDNQYDKNISNAKYWSANIGKIPYIESEQW